jgi:pSer/pThr/pTyr-binding forkhead associated (FHA) protein
MNTPMSASSKKLPYLKLLNRDALELEAEEQYILEDNMSIGRDSDNNIAIADSFLSGCHAMFIRQDKSYLIKDLDSTNGTFVNGEKLTDTPVQLKDRDKIKVGQLDLLYVAGREVK